MRPRLKLSLEDRFQDQLQCSLDHPVPNGWNRNHANFVPVLRYFHPARSLWLICPLHQLLAKLVQKSLYAFGLHGRKRDTINSWCPVVDSSSPISFTQSFQLTNVHIQTPEPPSRFGLRLDVESSSQVLQTDGCLSHLTLASRVELDLLCSKAPSLHRHYPASSLLQA